MISPLRKYALLVLLLFCGIVAGPLAHAIAHDHEVVECEFAKCLKTEAAPAAAAVVDTNSPIIVYSIPAKIAPCLRAERIPFLSRGPPALLISSAV